jgi:hypothetical protein
MPDHITWDDVDRTEKPGRYFVRGKSFQVKQINIDAWKDNPRGVWTLGLFTTLQGTHYVLKNFLEEDR